MDYFNCEKNQKKHGGLKAIFETICEGMNNVYSLFNIRLHIFLHLDFDQHLPNEVFLGFTISKQCLTLL